MKEISRFVPITKAKNDLLKLIRQVEEINESVAVTKNGVPVAVILNVEKYEGLLETLDILSDEVTMKSLRTSIRQGRKRNGCAMTRFSAVEKARGSLHSRGRASRFKTSAGNQKTGSGFN